MEKSRRITPQKKHQRQRPRQSLLRRLLRAIVPDHVLLRLIDGREESAHGLRARTIFDGKEAFHCREIRKIAREPVTRLRGVRDDPSGAENRERGGDAVCVSGKNPHSDRGSGQTSSGSWTGG